jgi:amino acid transporter
MDKWIHIPIIIGVFLFIGFFMFEQYTREFRKPFKDWLNKKRRRLAVRRMTHKSCLKFIPRQ